MKDQSKLIAALFIGAAAGAAAALLLAPDSGKATREDIADYVNDLVESAKDKAQTTATNVKKYGVNMVDRAKSKFQHAENVANEYAEAGQDGYDEAKDTVKRTANDVNNSIQGA